tara:strand:+ start:155 stop:463 length:309 start_codon:yes stop_codon:yes gene_type:complete
MKPDVKKILQKFSTEKVELSIVDELKDLIGKGLQIETEIKSQIQSYNGLLRAGNLIETKFNELKNMAEELGVPIPSELKKLENIAEGFLKKGNALKKVYNLF